ncbi:MAG: trypsin-like peptidase domain-containing protein [Clostridia bacterium]|nr:trypsin-like serine protease [Oscillospiraceae bacterium]MBQ7032103.1 trypsin-like peptidase domain-containing protein [Clostridia bacterium]
MQEFNHFEFHSDPENRDIITAPAPDSPVHIETKAKKKKNRTWLIAFASAMAGAIIASAAMPLVSGLISGNVREGHALTQGGSFRFPETTASTSTVTQITYNPENRTELTTVDIGKMVGPAVVGISSVVETQSYSFFGQATPFESESSGSGILISADGYIVTNNHVIEGAKKIKIILNNSKEFDATLVGADSKTDLAVLKIESTDSLPYAVLGDSAALEAGERCVAIGNPLGQELAGSLTQGIISALNRTLTVDNVTYTLIQTDAAINPGNSGGALVNVYGEVIGINTVKIGSSEVEGLGFAIPSNNAKPVIEDLINFGYVKGRPQIGVTLIYVTEQEARYYNIPASGLFVSDVSAGSGAAAAGVQKGDVILKCNGEDVKSSEEINAIRDRFKAGDSITLTVNRDGEILTLTVTLTEEKPTLAQ